MPFEVEEDEDDDVIVGDELDVDVFVDEELEDDVIVMLCVVMYILAILSVEWSALNIKH